MRPTVRTGALVATVLIAALAQLPAAQAAILGLVDDGSIVLIDTENATATKIYSSSSGRTALGNAGSLNPSTTPNQVYWAQGTQLYRNPGVQSPVTTNPATLSTSPVVALDADSDNDEVFYIDPADGVLKRVDLATKPATINTDGRTAPFADAGDLALSINEGTIYISYGNGKFATASGPDAYSNVIEYSFASGATPVTYVGLGVDQNDNLFGITDDGASGSQLWALTLSDMRVTPTLVDTIKRDGSSIQLTDAASVTPFVVPLPAALPLMLGALAGLGVIARRRNKETAATPLRHCERPRERAGSNPAA